MLVLLFCVVISVAVAAEDVAEDRSSSEVHYGYQRHYGYHPHLSGGIFKFYLFEPYCDPKFCYFKTDVLDQNITYLSSIFLSRISI